MTRPVNPGHFSRSSFVSNTRGPTNSAKKQCSHNNAEVIAQLRKKNFEKVHRESKKLDPARASVCNDMDARTRQELAAVVILTFVPPAAAHLMW